LANGGNRRPAAANVQTIGFGSGENDSSRHALRVTSSLPKSFASIFDLATRNNAAELSPCRKSPAAAGCSNEIDSAISY
jgi:hypothetical protein